MDLVQVTDLASVIWLSTGFNVQGASEQTIAKYSPNHIL